ncbi:MAG TPA: LemA family protein [Bacteroidales bacterium]|jgi:LemA protein|nr:LemA family protein [Bacteroidales bacterium]
MKKSLIWIGGLVLLAIILYSSLSGVYNGLVTSEQGVNKTWADVQGAYQRRADLIPNLVATVKQYANYEQQTLIQVIEARAKATKTDINIDPKNLDANTLAKFQESQGQLTSDLSKLLVIVEQYPQLKANENFMQLQNELERTENRINVERRNFNDAVQQYNTKLLKFPTNLLASMFGFKEKAYFEADKGAENAPKVDDLFNK